MPSATAIASMTQPRKRGGACHSPTKKTVGDVENGNLSATTPLPLSTEAQSKLGRKRRRRRLPGLFVLVMQRGRRRAGGMRLDTATWLVSCTALLALLVLLWNRHHQPKHIGDMDQNNNNSEAHLSNATKELEAKQQQEPEQQYPQQQEPQEQQHVHKIPNILIMTYSENLLLPPNYDKEGNLTTSSSTATAITPPGRELHALRQNVQHTMALHPTAHVRFLTDDDCVASIRAAFALRQASSEQQPQQPQDDDAQALVRFFEAEPRGMIKADICRGAALYETGGLYVDVDLGVRLNLFFGGGQGGEGQAQEEGQGEEHLNSSNNLHVLAPETEFATIRVHRASDYYPRAFFQAFIGATPQHEILWDYLQLFLQYYQTRHEQEDGEDQPGDGKNRHVRTNDHKNYDNNNPTADLRHNQPLGVLLLYRAYERFLQQQQQGRDLAKLGSIDELHQQYGIDIWQEVDSRAIPDRVLGNVVMPTWGGAKRACKMIVLQWNKKPQNDDKERPLIHVPFYSRIGDSRQCPIHHPLLSSQQQQHQDSSVGEPTMNATTV